MFSRRLLLRNHRLLACTLSPPRYLGDLLTLVLLVFNIHIAAAYERIFQSGQSSKVNAIPQRGNYDAFLANQVRN